MDRGKSFSKSFAVTGHPAKQEVTFIFQTYTDGGVKYCSILPVNEDIPEFTITCVKGQWVTDNTVFPDWFTESELDWDLDNLIAEKLGMNEDS